MTHRGVSHTRLGARALTVAAGLALFGSLFLTWTSLTVQQLALLAVTANGSLGRLSLAHNAWGTYAGVALALIVVSVLAIVTGVLNRLPLILPTALACLAALVFVVVQLSDPPSALTVRAPAALPSSGAVASSRAGAGETVAIIALGVAGIGMWAMLAGAHAERRRRRHQNGRGRSQRATGSAARPPRGARPAGELPDGSA